MPGIVVPVHNLKEEERRNLILRLRFGPQLQPNKNEPDGSLCIEGQAVVHQPRSRNVTNYNPFGPGDRVRHLLGRPLKIVNYSISETQQRKGLMNTTSASLKRRELEETGVIFENAHNNSMVDPDYQTHVDRTRQNPRLAKQRNIVDCDGNSTSQTLVSVAGFSDAGFYESGESGEGDAVADHKVTCLTKTHPTKQNADLLNKMVQPSTGGICGDGGHERFENDNQEKDHKQSARAQERMTGKLWPTSEEENAVEEKLAKDREEIVDPSSIKNTATQESNSPRPRKTSRTFQSRQSVSPRISSDDSRSQLKKTSSKAASVRKRSSKILEISKGTQNKDIDKSSDSRLAPSRDELQDLEVTTVRKFYDMPKSKPKNICFDYPGVDLTYLDVKRAIEHVIPDAFEKNKVVSMQFENVNVKLQTGSRENRWHIELADFVTRNKLVKSGLMIKHARKRSKTEVPVVRSRADEPRKAPAVATTTEKRRVAVKLYDMVMMEEYKLFLRRNAAEEKLQSVILMCAGRGHNLLSTML